MFPFARHSAYAALALVVLAAAPALAGESQQELRMGGLAFGKAPEAAQISTEVLDLAITPRNVIIKYVFLNQGPAPVTLTLSFPLPEIDFADPDASFAIPSDNALNFVGLASIIDGKPTPFAMSQRALLGGKDVTAAIQAAKLSLMPVGQFQNQLAAMAPAARDALAAQGLIASAGTDASGNALQYPTWSVRTSASIKATFAPGLPLPVELRYRTSIGTSPDTPLRQALRLLPEMAPQVAKERAQYCIDDGFLNGLDKLTGPAESNDAKFREFRIDYAFGSAAAAAGPIKDFHLIVDKGRADRVVSFCFNDLKRLSPTAFEMRAKNFAPEKDLKVLMIGKQ